MNETVETGQETVTSELLVDKARQAGENLRLMNEKCPKTAGALLLYSRVVDKEKPDDPDALVVREMAMSFQYGEGGNATNLSAAVAGGEVGLVNAERVNQGLTRLVETTASSDPEELKPIVRQLLVNTKVLLMSEGSKWRVEHLLNRRKDIYEAGRELGIEW